MLNGKGFFIWQINRIHGGEPALIADEAQSAGLSNVIIKIADGISAYNIDPSGNDLVSPLVNAFQAKGIESWGWQYLYGDNPSAEAARAIQCIHETGVTGFVINAESEFKRPGKQTAAKSYIVDLRDNLPFFPIALSSYRYPSLHQEFPWQEFLSGCDYAMPQVYWVNAHDPAYQLNRSLAEYRSMTTLPVIPTGSAFSLGNWEPTTQDIDNFLNAAIANSLSGANFWEWYPAHQLPDLWETIAHYNWPIVTPPPPAPCISVHAQVWASKVNVRSGPGSEFPTIGSIVEGTQLTIYAIQRGWSKINLDSNEWVYSYYLDALE